ncbi:hypothetical protein Y032_0001g334 [Ancylostoma ceylanicum]|uniref:DUF7596 domain-containing protein n=2 Tax=Ancylostoma ceylanicum TaxID=53326 RepID=A0A016W3P0_9BILA|nr:hypothetical protein Y032_0001g334 [Ancylostoma ceylanicum]
MDQSFFRALFWAGAWFRHKQPHAASQPPFAPSPIKMSLHQIQLPSKPCNLMAFLELDKSSVLKAEEFSGSKSAFIWDENGELVAKQTIVKYTPTHAYCIYSDCSDEVAGKNIRVKEDEDAHHLKLVSIETEKENRRLLPLYVQFHTVPEARPAEAHLVDRLAEHALGRFNLELKKNVTHDSFVESDSWRDEAGFIVTDRNRFVYVTFKTSALLPTLTPAGTKITKFSAKDLEAVSDFDTSVCGFTRDEAVEFITSNSTVFVAKGNGVVDGVIAGKGSRIFALYGETMEIAHALIKHYIIANNLTQVSFFTREDVWECEPLSSRRVHRRHTRAVPSSIKWSKVYALNMGFHIV